jgi:RHS repeat-associated protein
LEGGWQDASLLAAGVTEGGEPVKEGQAVIRAAVDDGDSYRGLQSLKLGQGGVTEVVVSKRLSLPVRAPFGVSEGSFAIGVARVGSEAALLPRRRLIADADIDDLPVPTPVSDESALSPEVPSSGPPSGEPIAPLSALPSGSYYIYSFDGRLMQVYDMFGALLKDYVYMGDRLVAEYDYVGSRLLYYTPDQINSTRVVTDQSGNVVYSAAHDPYGGIQQTWVGAYDPMPKFSGKERDAESQFDYFGARYYDRNQYRFISIDPVIVVMASQTDSQLWNRYSYCQNNPILYKDATGKYDKDWHYGVTLYCALLSGFSPEEAVTIAQASRYVDVNPDTESIKHPEFHFPSFGFVSAMESMSYDSENLAIAGTACHAIQDSQSHYGLDSGLWSGILHIIGDLGFSKDPDKPSDNVDRAINATRYTLDFLSGLKAGTSEKSMTMSIDIDFLNTAYRLDMDPITYVVSVVTSLVISVSLLR